MIGAVVERSVEATGVRLAVAELGDRSAPTVVLLHGYPDTKEVWEQVAAELASRFHVVAYDMRGAGGSSAPGDTAGYDLERLVDDFAAVIDDVVPGRAVHLVGHDWGSISGWDMVTAPRLRGRVALVHLDQRSLARPFGTLVSRAAAPPHPGARSARCSDSSGAPGTSPPSSCPCSPS